jgi:hypothetical protein
MASRPARGSGGLGPPNSTAAHGEGGRRPLSMASRLGRRPTSRSGRLGDKYVRGNAAGQIRRDAPRTVLTRHPHTVVGH